MPKPRYTLPGDCPLRWLPLQEDPALWLYAALGPAAFRRFRARFGGRYIWIPKSGHLFPCRNCPDRPEHIRSLRRGGLSAGRIGRRFGLSTGRVYALLKTRTTARLPLRRR